MAPRACLFAVLLVLCADARAMDIPASYRYRIHHQIFGDIGYHRMTVRRDGDLMVVEHTAELAVEILGFAAFHRRTRFREVWRDERLIEFRMATCRTIDDTISSIGNNTPSTPIAVR